MTYTASLIVPERDVFRLFEAFVAEPALARIAIDAADAGDGNFRLTFYLAAPPEAWLAGLIERTVHAVAGGAAEFAWSSLRDTDWVAKSLEGLPPVRAGRFLVYGHHGRARCGPNDIGIEIEAGEAFGTGHHGTTAGCLTAIERTLRARPIRNALDLGTGSGVLAIAIARRTHVPVLATDIDPVAVRVATANVRLNGVAPLVHIAAAAGLRGRGFRRPGRFDLIVANILAGPLVGLAPAIRRALAPSGTVILSGLLPDQQNRVAAAYRAAGLRLERADRRDGWVILTLTPRPGSRPRRSRAGCSGSA